LKMAESAFKLKLDSKDRQISELEKLIMMMTSSAMSTEGQNPTLNIKNQVA